jgi:acetoin utilization protein AcuB
MLVRERMSVNPITVHPNIPFQDALRLMQEHRIRRLPVVDNTGKLVGVVSERDLLYASPSPATSLSVWELNYLLSKLEIGELMQKEVYTTTPDTPIEDAARLMIDRKIGGLPVIDQYYHVVGVITETDIFKSFVEMVSGGRKGLRLTVRMAEKRGALAELISALSNLGGDIISVSSFYDRDPGERELVIKVRHLRKEQVSPTLHALGDQLIDAREV